MTQKEFTRQVDSTSEKSFFTSRLSQNRFCSKKKTFEINCTTWKAFYEVEMAEDSHAKHTLPSVKIIFIPWREMNQKLLPYQNLPALNPRKIRSTSSVEQTFSCGGVETAWEWLRKSLNGNENVSQRQSLLDAATDPPLRVGSSSYVASCGANDSSSIQRTHWIIQLRSRSMRSHTRRTSNLLSLPSSTPTRSPKLRFSRKRNSSLISKKLLLHFK